MINQQEKYLLNTYNGEIVYRRPNIHKEMLPSKGYIMKKKNLSQKFYIYFIYKFTAIQKVDGIKEQTLVNDL